MNETVYAQWRVTKDQTRLTSLTIVLVIVAVFLVSFYVIFLVNKSTNLVLLIIPILLFLLLLALLPEFFKSWGAFKESVEVYLTEKGVYLRHLEQKDKYDFLAWEQMKSYDSKSSTNSSFLGNLFPKPTHFIVRMYDDSSFNVPGLKEDADVFLAYLKEKNIAFGFVKN